MPEDRLRRDLFAVVPDHPVWIEARAVLLDPACRIFGDQTGYVIRADRLRLGAIGGDASEALVRAALEDIGNQDASGAWAVVMPEGFTSEGARALAGWNATDADIFREPAGGVRAAEVNPLAEVRLMEAAEVARLDHLPAALCAELSEAHEHGDLAAAWVDGLPVSFCAVACKSDTLWDISIHTAEAYRRRGLAGAAVAFLASRMRDRGKSAVWGAHSHNVASRTLAGKLGFERVGRLFLFENGCEQSN